MLATFMNKKVSVMRLTTVSGNRKALATTQTPWSEIQNIDTRHQQVSEGIASKTYKAWFDIDAGIQEGDIIRNQDNNQRFKVIGVEKHGQGLGLMAEHLEVVMVKYTI